MFPASIGRAAAFNPKLELAAGRALALEGRAKYNDYKKQHGGIDDGYAITYYAPVVNIARAPRWGRTQETFGESPFLSSQLGVAFVNGIQLEEQGASGDTYLLGSAMVKHFAAWVKTSVSALLGHVS